MPASACRARQRNLALVPHQSGGAGGRNHDRHIVAFAENGHRLAACRHVHQRARLQAYALEHRAIVAQRNFVFGAAIDEFKQALGRAL
jgi:hypothetical protein